MKRLIIFTSTLVLFALLTFAVNVEARGRCDVTVVSSGDLQAEVDNASTGDTICLSGAFVDEPTISVATSNITIKSARGNKGILDGGDGPAFRLEDGLSNVAIQDLEIRNRTGFRGGGIESWDRSTSNITVQNNNIHDNTYNGILVGSEGKFVHSNWVVKDNSMENHGFANVELTNCKNCSIVNNTVAKSLFGIIVQARNSSTTGDTDTELEINSVKVLHNEITDAGLYGIYALSFKGHPTLFTPITGGSVEFSNVVINNNVVEDSGIGGVIFWGFNDVLSDNATINHNTIECQENFGVRVLEATATSVVRNVKVVNNDFTNCATDVQDGGTETKIPPVPVI